MTKQSYGVEFRTAAPVTGLPLVSGHRPLSFSLTASEVWSEKVPFPMQAVIAAARSDALERGSYRKDDIQEEAYPKASDILKESNVDVLIGR